MKLSAMDADDVLELVSIEIKNDGSQAAFAKRIGFSPQYINDVLQRRRALSESFLEAIGLEKIIAYRRMEKIDG